MPLPIWQQIGEDIARIRRQRGLTRAQLARELGVSPAFLLRVERGERGISDLGLLERTASILGLGADQRLGLYLAAISAPPELRSLLRRSELVALLGGLMELSDTPLEEEALKQVEALGLLLTSMARLIRKG